MQEGHASRGPFFRQLTVMRVGWAPYLRKHTDTWEPVLRMCGTQPLFAALSPPGA